MTPNPFTKQKELNDESQPKIYNNIIIQKNVNLKISSNFGST